MMGSMSVLIDVLPGYWIAVAVHALTRQHILPRGLASRHRRQDREFSERRAENMARYRPAERPVSLDCITMLAAVRQVATVGRPAEPILDRNGQLQLACLDQELTGKRRVCLSSNHCQSSFCLDPSG